MSYAMLQQEGVSYVYHISSLLPDRHEVVVTGRFRWQEGVSYAMS